MDRKTTLEQAAAGSLCPDSEVGHRVEARRLAVRQMHSALVTIAFGVRLLCRAIASFLR